MWNDIYVVYLWRGCAQQYQQPRLCRCFVFHVTGSSTFSKCSDCFHFNSQCTFYTLRWILRNYFSIFIFTIFDAYKLFLGKWSVRLASPAASDTITIFDIFISYAWKTIYHSHCNIAIGVNIHFDVLNFPNAMANSFARNQICHVAHFYALFYFQSPVHVCVFYYKWENSICIQWQ